MLDIKLIREQPDLVREGMRKKGVDAAVLDRLSSVDTERKNLRQSTEQEQAQLNAASEKMAQASPEERDAMREELRALSDRVKTANSRLTELDEQWTMFMRQIPNIPASDVPDGVSDKENVILRTEGAKPEFAFTPKDHEEIATALDLLDMERGAKVSGAKFYYLKNELVILEQAVLRWALDLLRAKGFTLMTVPHLARANAFYGAGHFATSEDAENGDAYRLERDELYLAGTAEVGLVNYHADEILREADLSLRYAGISACYRREAGTYGKETKGLFRVHQFHKVEMVVFSRPEDAEREHELLLSIAEDMLQKLGLHYQVMLNCAGDLGHPQAKKWDIEVWLPGMNKYGETHSCSNDTDWQARSLNIRYRHSGEEHQKEISYVHTLNNTALASPRILVAILENYQQEDGSVVIPEVLLPYTGFDRITSG
jgi:seryl-tRNA synthetase